MVFSIAFIHGYESEPYAGPLRPFVNWTETIAKKFPKVSVNLILLNPGSRVVENLSKRLGKRLTIVRGINELLRVIKDLSPDVVMGDDYIPRLRVLYKISKYIADSSIAIYIQFLYGLHSISRSFYYKHITLKKRLLYKLSSLIPYKLLSVNYLKMIRKNNIFIANSNVSKNFFLWLYKIFINDVIYPPVNTEIFNQDIGEKYSDYVLIYLGSSGGDINISFLKKIINICIDSGKNIRLFGNKKIGKMIKKDFGKKIKYYELLNDYELAKLYATAQITISPQIWELFGYVAVESMACGTPVLAFNYLGHSETVINGRTGLLANTEREFIEKLEMVLKGNIAFDKRYIRDYAVKTFSADVSTNKLINKLIKLSQPISRGY